MENQQLLPIKRLDVGTVLRNAWKFLPGSKLPIWLTMIAAIILLFIVDALIILITHENWNQQTYWVAHILMPLVNAIFLAPFVAGQILIGAKRMRGEAVETWSGFKYFHRYIPLAITLLITTFLTNIANIIFNHPHAAATLANHKKLFDTIALVYSFVVSTLFMIALPLVAEKKYAPLQAISKSFVCVGNSLGRAILLVVICAVLLFLSFIPLIIGLILQNPFAILLCLAVTLILLIWLLPFTFLVAGGIYHQLTE